MESPRVLGDRYRLDRRLATGGMGEVWKATDELLGRPVAVKLLRQEYVSDDSFRDRFRAEARFAASLQHSGIAQVYDYGEQDDLAYLVMELVPGQTLSRILALKHRLPADTTLDIVEQAARALHVAHVAGIVHRDIKPANLMVTSDGTLKITDFGIARGGGSTTVTQTGQVMGTAQYISPEQATGERITPASDLYSLGIVAYECVAGEPPFAADTPLALALMHVREEPPPLPDDVPPALRGLVTALIAKDPADRPADAQEVADRAHRIHRSLGAADDDPLAETDIAPAGFASAGEATQPRSSRVRTADIEPDATTGLRRPTRLAIVAACAVILLGAGVFTVGSLWQHHGHTKLVDGNRQDRAVHTGPSSHPTEVPSTLPSDRPVPSDSVSSPAMVPSQVPSPTISVPTTKPTKTIKPPKRTPTVPATDPPPTSPDPEPSNSVGPPGTAGRA
jgi:eukaryotic-like serine/threonine-protein kinase